jgi:NAD(P) transhydrogenase
MSQYDLIVIGSGPAGEKAALQATDLGKRVAMIEARQVLGGAVINTGTLPSKTLRESALYLSGLQQRGLFGVDYHLDGQITVEAFMYRKQQVIRKQLELTSRRLERHNVDVINGRGSFLDPHSIRIEKPSGAALVMTADHIVVATGSYPYRPSSIPFDDKNVYDSDTILNLDRIPRSLTILGAGVIGCEYACIFAALGVEVVLVDPHPTMLPFLDGQIASLLTTRMKRLEIELLLEEEATEYQVQEGRVRTCFQSGKQVETEKFLFTSGRSGNTAGLGLEKIGIEPNKRGQIAVNEYFQTSVPHIYAVGDVIGFPALASTSMEQGRIAASHAFDPDFENRPIAILPHGIYTIPEISMVGETEETLREKGTPYVVGCAAFEDNARGQIIGDTEGLMKLIFAPEDGKILGVHIIGENATELIHIGAATMYHSGTVECFLHSAFNYPTLSDTYKDAAFDGLRKTGCTGIGLRHSAADACRPNSEAPQ